jgi:hypothetical protein
VPSRTLKEKTELFKNNQGNTMYIMYRIYLNKKSGRTMKQEIDLPFHSDTDFLVWGLYQGTGFWFDSWKVPKKIKKKSRSIEQGDDFDYIIVCFPAYTFMPSNFFHNFLDVQNCVLLLHITEHLVLLFVSHSPECRMIPVVLLSLCILLAFSFVTIFEASNLFYEIILSCKMKQRTMWMSTSTIPIYYKSVQRHPGNDKILGYIVHHPPPPPPHSAFLT